MLRWLIQAVTNDVDSESITFSQYIHMVIICIYTYAIVFAWSLPVDCVFEMSYPY